MNYNGAEMDKLFVIGFFVACCGLSLVTCQQLDDSKKAKIVKFINQNDGSGNYHFEVECSDGIKREETGVLMKNAGDENAWISVTGSYSYIGTDGRNYSVKYVADKGGFRPIFSIDGEGHALVNDVVSGIGEKSTSSSAFDAAGLSAISNSGSSSGGSSSSGIKGVIVDESNDSSSSVQEHNRNEESDTNLYVPPPPTKPPVTATVSTDFDSSSQSFNTINNDRKYIPPVSQGYEHAYTSESKTSQKYVAPNMKRGDLIPSPLEINKIMESIFRRSFEDARNRLDDLNQENLLVTF